VPIALSIPMLAAAPTTPNRFKSALLQRTANADWDQDVSYLRELYNQIASGWESGREQGEALYQSTEPRLRELLLVLRSIADAAIGTQNAVRDFELAARYAKNRVYEMANKYLGAALTKVHRQLEGFSKYGSTKLGYGYDTSGEVQRGGGTSGEGRHLWDTGNSPKHDHTQNNPANMLFDADAESDYPELAAFKHKRVYWPPRTR
jgi:hypothetical protein